MLFACQSYVLVITRTSFMSLVCTRMSSVCHSYVLARHPYVTRMSSVCHSYVPRLWFYHEPIYVLACHPYVTRMYSYVTRTWFYHELSLRVEHNINSINFIDLSDIFITVLVESNLLQLKMIRQIFFHITYTIFFTSPCDFLLYGSKRLYHKIYTDTK